ncbi:MAG: glutaredoxin family protein [Myxococcales bacterium]|nr:glutaredoxin family protein [Myxococcales bacterium]
MRRTRSVRPLILLLLPLLGCEPERPPAPEADARPPARAAGEAPGAAGEGPAAAPTSATLPATPEKVVLTYAAERGVFKDTSKPDAVDEAARGMVRVTFLDGPAPPSGTVWVANLRAPSGDGSWPLTTVPRDQFEELALGQGMSSQVDLPAGIEPPPAKPSEGEVIVYKTEWCGVCKKLLAYLDRKGVPYVAKDIEKDPVAAGELQQKAREKGIKTGSVPVIDVRGEMMVGFDRARLEKLL